MKSLFTQILIIALPFFLFILTSCPAEDPIYGLTDENIVTFQNTTRNVYSVSMTKNHSILKIVKLDSQTFRFKTPVFGLADAAIDLNSDSTVYWFNNLKTLIQSKVVISYKFLREDYFRPENSLRIKDLIIKSDLPEEIFLDSISSSGYYVKQGFDKLYLIIK